MDLCAFDGHLECVAVIFLHSTKPTTVKRVVHRVLNKKQEEEEDKERMLIV